MAKKSGRTVAIGVQNFETIIRNDYFYVDKTGFIKEWWENGDSVTLIARPRRFGKTLNMNMLEMFFSNQYKKQEELFQNLEIWKDEEMKKLAGEYPVIFFSFASVKDVSCDKAILSICDILKELYINNCYLLQSDKLVDEEKVFYKKMMSDITEDEAKKAIYHLSGYMYKHFGKRVLILLDEYDTPMQEAYISGYWDDFTVFIRNMFNSTFKTNPYLERAVMTGITRVSKESIFSDLNNLAVVTTTSKPYATSFGFTETEVYTAMDELGLTDKVGVKKWYDGFVFGDVSDIYNPWSIINYFKHKTLGTYWANTSSNSLVGKLIRESGAKTKKLFECLIEDKTIEVPVDEQIVYKHLDNSEGAIWSLMLATGYLKVLNYQTGEEYIGNRKPMYELALTNEEVKMMFYQMVSDWFERVDDYYNDFIKALVINDLKAMNVYMNRVSQSIFSYFDTGKGPLGAEPEKFYHGFVLGLMVDMSKDYQVRSNRESGFGRYDIMIYPKELNKGDGIIIEFKVRADDEKDLNETVQAALKQIEDRNYATELIALGFKEENIRKYGFAFEGKKVLIGQNSK